MAVVHFEHGDGFRVVTLAEATELLFVEMAKVAEPLGRILGLRWGRWVGRNHCRRTCRDYLIKYPSAIGYCEQGFISFFGDIEGGEGMLPMYSSRLSGYHKETNLGDYTVNCSNCRLILLIKAGGILTRKLMMSCHTSMLMDLALTGVTIG